MCVHICANTHVLALGVMCMSRSENSWQESVLSFHGSNSFHHLVVRQLYLLTHLVKPQIFAICFLLSPFKIVFELCFKICFIFHYG